MKTAKLPNGEVLQFPDETPDSVMDETVKRHIAEGLAKKAGLGKVMNGDFMQFLGGAFETIIDVAVRRYLSNSKGDQGERGFQGDQGIQGEIGERGEKGDTGDQGPEGKRGQRGEKGDKGERGERGFTGERGLKGDQGNKGDKGDRGEKGDRGNHGEKGEKGDRGAEGSIGPAGGRGRPGAFWRGSWTSGVAYNDYDAVEYQGSSYVCTASNVTTAPPGPHWQIIAVKGDSANVTAIAKVIFQGFTTSEYDASIPTFSGGSLTLFTLKSGGISGTTVNTVEYNYSGGQLTSKVLKSPSGTVLNTLTFSYSGSTLTSKILT